MEKERSIKTLSVVALIVAVLGLTIAFAALSQTLTINGSAKLDASKWGLKFDNLVLASVPNPDYIHDYIEGEANIKTEDNTVIENMNVRLKTPGDKVVYKVDLVNEGSINAKIDEIVKTTTPNYISFKVYIGNTGKYELKEGYVLGKETSIPLRIEIEFIKDITKDQLPTEARTIKLSYGVTFVQTDEEATSIGQTPSSACTTFEKKDTYSVGNEIALCNNDTGKSEDFYVISDNGDTVTALAKYNLLVGNEVVWEDTNFENYTSLTPIDPTTEGYGLQSSDAKVATIDNIVWTGTIAFVDNDEGYHGYWTDSNHNLLSKYGTSYPAYVFDNNSSLWTPVQNYRNYLQSLGYTSVNIKLLNYDDMIALGCIRSGYSCEAAPSWVYSTGYWIGSTNDYYRIMGIDSTGFFGYAGFENGKIFGLRPVITISKTDL